MAKKFDTLRRSVAELFTIEDDDPEPRGSRHSSTEVLSGAFERNRPPKDDLQTYWRIYETYPLVQKSIDSFASEVVEPGFYIECEDEKTAEEMEEWLQEAAILHGEKKKNIIKLFKACVVQYEVRGTVLIEKVRGKKSGNLVSFYLHNPEEFEVYTHPRTNLLVEPDDTDVEGIPTMKTTVDGEKKKVAVAYVQYDTNLPRWTRRKDQGKETDIPFTTEEIMKMTRDADIGEVFGTSAIESIAERVEALQKVLQDNDAAIASKAYPFWLVQFGVGDDGPWETDEISDFMEHHEVENFRPSMKQGVAGDVDIKVVSGETADLEEVIAYNVNHIIAGLPTPKYHLGGFSEQVGQPEVDAQEAAFRRAVREMRHEIEDEFTPVLRKVAEERGLDKADTVQLVIGRPDVHEVEDPEGENIIRYVSDSPREGEKRAPGERNPTRQPKTVRGPSGSPQGTPGAEDGPDPTRQGDTMSADSGASESPPTIWDELGVDEGDEYPFGDSQVSWAQLASTPGVVDIDPEIRSLREEAIDAIIETRARTVSRLGARFANTPNVGDDQTSQFIQQAVDTVMREMGLREAAVPEMRSAMRKSLQELSSESHEVPVDVNFGTRHEENARHYAQNYELAVRKAADDMARLIELAVRRGAERRESWSDIEGRIESGFSDARIADRMDLIAEMEVLNAVESTKMQEMEAHPDVGGYRVLNICDDSTTQLCRHLAGCGAGEPVEVRFDADETLSEQLMAQVDSGLLYRGFTPLPPAPPFHWRCRSVLVPIA